MGRSPPCPRAGGILRPPFEKLGIASGQTEHRAANSIAKASPMPLRHQLLGWFAWSFGA